ncbi:hypothetical protein FKM82_031115 [Ascaphus truei]
MSASGLTGFASDSQAVLTSRVKGRALAYKGSMLKKKKMDFRQKVTHGVRICMSLPRIPCCSGSTACWGIMVERQGCRPV